MNKNAFSTIPLPFFILFVIFFVALSFFFCLFLLVARGRLGRREGKEWKEKNGRKEASEKKLYERRASCLPLLLFINLVIADEALGRY